MERKHPKKMAGRFPNSSQKTSMTRSAENDPEVTKLLEELEKLGYPMPLPERWGAKRAKEYLKLIISAVTPGICPVCGRKLE